jgi:hypothetical protein
MENGSGPGPTRNGRTWADIIRSLLASAGPMGFIALYFSGALDFVPGLPASPIRENTRELIRTREAIVQLLNPDTSPWRQENARLIREHAGDAIRDHDREAERTHAELMQAVRYLCYQHLGNRETCAELGRRNGRSRRPEGAGG